MERVKHSHGSEALLHLPLGCRESGFCLPEAAGSWLLVLGTGPTARPSTGTLVDAVVWCWLPGEKVEATWSWK